MAPVWSKIARCTNQLNQVVLNIGWLIVCCYWWFCDTLQKCFARMITATNYTVSYRMHVICWYSRDCKPIRVAMKHQHDNSACKLISTKFQSILLIRGALDEWSQWTATYHLWQINHQQNNIISNVTNRRSSNTIFRWLIINDHSWHSKSKNI